MLIQLPLNSSDKQCTYSPTVTAHSVDGGLFLHLGASVSKIVGTFKAMAIR